MKTSIKILLLYSILITSSCEKNEEIVLEEGFILEKSNIENASQEQKEAYARFHLLKIAKYLDMKLSNKSINEQILTKGFENGKSKTFYAEYIVESIIHETKQDNSDDIQKSLNAFENIEGENWQVTISIPNFKKVIEKKELDETKPIFILSVDSEKEVNSEEVDGYQLSSENNMEKIDEKVNEEIALSNSVYKVGITIMPIDYENEGGSGGNSTGTNDGNLGGTNGTGAGSILTSGSSYSSLLPSTSGLTIRLMRALIKKESWIEDNEIHFKGFRNALIADNNTDGFATSTDQINGSGGNDGELVEKFGNSDISNGDTKFVDFLIAENSSGIDGSIYYSLFENDNWPAPLKEATFNFTNGTFRRMYFRSWEGVYDKAIILHSPQNGYSFYNNPPYPRGDTYSVDNGQIKYSLRATN